MMAKTWEIKSEKQKKRIKIRFPLLVYSVNLFLRPETLGSSGQYSQLISAWGIPPHKHRY